MKSNYNLGNKQSSEQLIKDLYIDLRNKLIEWTAITQQTPQARMGYIGQHLVSVVTGYPGGKSGARGYDLIIDQERYGEIKTCYRVDQLGKCLSCDSPVSGLEFSCPKCGSTDIKRNDDSKWLINIRHDAEFANILQPYRYYFVLFEFEDIINIATNKTILASIWEVDPKTRGFAFCMVDYYLNIRAKSSSKAPFNMWPHSLKFALTQPTLIYRSKIFENDSIETCVFPNSNPQQEKLLLHDYKNSQPLTIIVLKKLLKYIAPHIRLKAMTKANAIQYIEDLISKEDIPASTVADALADAIYLPLISQHRRSIPTNIKDLFIELQ